jgi:hypothetical protein
MLPFLAPNCAIIIEMVQKFLGEVVAMALLKDFIPKFGKFVALLCYRSYGVAYGNLEDIAACSYKFE